MNVNLARVELKKKFNRDTFQTHFLFVVSLVILKVIGTSLEVWAVFKLFFQNASSSIPSHLFRRCQKFYFIKPKINIESGHFRQRFIKDTS